MVALRAGKGREELLVAWSRAVTITVWEVADSWMYFESSIYGISW